jgi:hypothetical protein
MADKAKQRIIREIKRLYVKRVPLNIATVERRHPELIEAVCAIDSGEVFVSLPKKDFTLIPNCKDVRIVN